MSVVCEGTGTQPSIADLLEGLCDLNRIHSGLYPFNVLLWHHVFFLVAQSNLWWLAPTLISYVEEDLLFLSVCKPCDSRRNKHFCLKELGLTFIHYYSGWYWTSKCDCSDQHCNWKKPEKCLCNHKKSYQKLHPS